MNIKVHNKTKKAGKIGIRTKDGDATAGEDYEAIDQAVEFTANEQFKEVPIVINDDEEWEPDEDFYVELYDVDTNEPLQGSDCKTTVRIIDDDEPGMLSFEHGDSMMHSAMEKECIVKVIRTNGCSGKIQCEYRTIELD